MKHVVLPNTDCCTQACCCLHQVWSHIEAAFCSFVSWHCNLRRMNLFGSSYCIFQGSSREVAAATVPWCQDDCYLSLQARTTWIRKLLHTRFQRQWIAICISTYSGLLISCICGYQCHGEANLAKHICLEAFVPQQTQRSVSSLSSKSLKCPEWRGKKLSCSFEGFT